MAGNVSNTITLRAQGVDATTRMLRGLSARIGAFSGVVSAISQRAFSSLASTVQEMTSLSDRAADARTTSAELRKLAAAMGEIGVRGASIDMVSHAMQEMVRRTGEEGTRGFMRILTSIAQVESAQERATLLAEAFGKQAGAAFAVLVDNGVNGLINGLGAVADGFWTASEEAVTAGDKLADRWAQISFGLQTGFQNAILTVTNSFADSLDIADDNLSKFTATAVKYALDGIRTIMGALMSLGTILTQIGKAWLVFERAKSSALKSIFGGDIEGAKNAFSALPDEMRELFRETGHYIDQLFPDDLFKAPADGARESFRRMAQDAAQEGSEFIRNALNRPALQNLETKFKPIAASIGKTIAVGARSFAGFLGFGSNEARKLAFAQQVDPIERQMLRTQREQLAALQTIAQTAQTIEATP